MGATRIKECRACRHQMFTEIDSLGEFPYANLFPDVTSAAPQEHALTLLICQGCSLCQLNVLPDLDELYTNYLWTTNSSTTVHDYLDGLQKRLTKILGDRPNKVIEIACNDGTFLKKFEGEAECLIGIDPARNLSNHSRDSNILLFTDFFSEDLVKRNPDVLSNAQLLIARNVLAHIPDIDTFLRGCKKCLSKDGLLYLEFHDGDEIINKLQFDSIYHEHQCYITEAAIKLLVERLGFTVIDCWRGPIGGSSLSLIIKQNADLNNASKKEKQSRQQERLVRAETLRWQKFRQEVDLYKRRVTKILKTLKSEGQVIAGFGASARSTTIARFCNMEQWLSAIVDSSSFKQGRFWTGTQILVSSPGAHDWGRIDVVVLFAWNFEQEIVAQLSHLGFRGRILRLLPYEPTFIESKNAD